MLALKLWHRSCGSRRRRILAFQMTLTERQGLPLSHLLRLIETDARCPREKVGDWKRSLPLLLWRRGELRWRRRRRRRRCLKGRLRRRVWDATVWELRLLVQPCFFRWWAFNLMSPHNLPIPSYKCFLSSCPASHHPTCLATIFRSAARCLGSSGACQLLLEMVSIFECNSSALHCWQILVFTSSAFALNSISCPFQSPFWLPRVPIESLYPSMEVPISLGNSAYVCSSIYPWNSFVGLWRHGINPVEEVKYNLFTHLLIGV